MGRRALGLKYVQVGLREEVLAEVDAVAGSGGRAEFIRDAVEAKLRGKPPEMVKVDREAVMAVVQGDPGAVVADVSPTKPVVEQKAPKVIHKPVVRPDPVPDRPLKPFEISPRDRERLVLEALSDGGLSSRVLGDRLGWEFGLVDKVLMKLSTAGLIRYIGGIATKL